MPDSPEVSIVILTKNVGSAFRQTLSQIFHQQTARRYEVIVVDSGSTDETLEIMKDFPVNKFNIPARGFNFGLTRDYGFSLAAGEYIITLSQDAVPRDDQWMENMVTPFRSNPNLIAVQGTQRAPEDETAFYWDRTGRFFFTAEAKRWIEAHTIGLSFVNCAVRRAFWETHRIGFTPASSDKKFQTLIHAAGGDVVVAEEAVCLHGHNYTFRSLVKTLCRQGAGDKYAGMKYSLGDCTRDIIRNRGMLREAFSAWRRKEITAWHEFFFLFIRPACIYWGNRTRVRNSEAKADTLRASAGA